MATDEDRLIYTQRYETFRHLDTLRWHVPTFSLTGGGILLGLTSPSNGLPPWWALFVLSLLLALSSYAVFRIRKGIDKNNETLKVFAEKVGDMEVPKLSKKYEASHWSGLLLAALSILSLLTALAQSSS